MQSVLIRNEIQALGRELGPEVMARMLALFAQEQTQLVAQVPASATNVRYGENPRHQLDLYCPQDEAEHPLPVLVFVHGGGFLKGDKGDDTRWYNACVGRMAASRGMIGVVMNYRLAPEHTWPSGGEDIALVVDWLKQRIADFGGDAGKIVLCGTSAGACHVATYLQLNPDTCDVKGLILLSGLYGVTELEERDSLYYGPQDSYPRRMPLPSLVRTAIPLFVACTENDPERFQHETIGLLQQRLTYHHALDRAMLLSGHNHYSVAGHLGTSDTRLADELVSFITEVTRQ